MAKNQEVAPVSTQGEQEFPLALNEFCARLSATDRRVELIAGFHHQEVAAGRTKDLESAFRARFEAFVNQPA